MNKLWKINLIVFVLVFLIQISLVSATYYNGLKIYEFPALTGTGVAFTPNGVSTNGSVIAVSADANNMIYIYDMNGNWIKNWSTNVNHVGVAGISWQDGYWYGMDAGSTASGHKLYKYDANGVYQSVCQTPTSKTYFDIATNSSNVLAVNNEGSIYVLNYACTELQSFAVSAGVFKYGIARNESNIFTSNRTSVSVGTFNGIYLNNLSISSDASGLGMDYYGNYMYLSSNNDKKILVYLFGDDESNPPTITIHAPIGDYNYGFSSQLINITIEDDTFVDSIWFSYNGTNQTLTGTSNYTNFSLANAPYNLTVWANDSYGNVNSSYVEWNYKIFSNGEIYNNQSYETSSETFTINVTANSSLTAANFIYGGIPYAGTKLGNIWSRTINMPLGSSNKNFYWSFTYAGEIINSTTHTQTINYTHLALCNATYNVSYINFTFMDEATSTILNVSVDLATFDYWLGDGTVTKEYIFQNTTDNFNYAFCFAPADKPLTIDLDFKYSKTSYPQRTHTYDDKALTNSTTTKVLYLLSSTDGIYSTIQFLDAATNDPISGVEVTAEREILGIWTLINQGVTDAAGAITFWVNPDYEHRITASKTGYANVQETITPTQTSYTIFMGTSATVSVPGYIYKGIKYVTYPPAGRLEPNTVYTFGFNVTADEGNIVSCRIDIKNLSLSTVATSSTGCGAYGGNISVSYNTGSNSKLFGYYYVDLGDGLELFKANDAWHVESHNVTSTGGLISFFESLGDLSEWGDTHNRQEFSKITFFFFIMILTIGVFTFFSGYELSSPGAALILVWAFIAFGAVSGIIGIEGLSPDDWWNKYVYFIIVSFLFFGFILNKIRRDNM